MEREIYHKTAELEAQHWWFVSRRKIIETLISHKLCSLGQGSEILDIGCGTGGNLKLLSLPTKNVIGLEPDIEAVMIARNKSGKTVYPGKLPDQVPLSLGTFDLILLLDVLEHLDNDTEALQAAITKLKTNGHIVITVPAFYFLWSEHDDLHHHKRRYNLKELLKKLDDCGLKINYCSYFNFWLFPLIYLVRILKSKTSFLQNKRDLTLPSKIINKLLINIMSSEKYLLKYTRLPIGVSIIAVGQKL